MTLLDGKLVANKLLEQDKADLDNFIRSHASRKPELAIVIVGDDKASEIYVRNKLRLAKKLGITDSLVKLPATSSYEDIEAKLISLDVDDNIDGILLQLPLPENLRSHEAYLTQLIDSKKDVDGFSYLNSGKLFQKVNCVKPATAFGIVRLLDYYKIDLDGLNAVIVGRSNIVGLPTSKLLLDKNCTVTVCHSHTKDLKRFTSNADLVVTAIGKAKFFDDSYFKKGAIVIDVGMDRSLDGHLCGDVDFEKVKEKASFITPVPGGIGPMTVETVSYNLLQLYYSHISHR